MDTKLLVRNKWKGLKRMHAEAFSSLTCAAASVLQGRAEAPHRDDREGPKKILMKPLQGKHKIIDVGHAVSFAAQPAYEFKAELCREAPQVAEPHLLQEVTSVAPEHHINIHVLCALPITTVGTETETFGLRSDRSENTKAL